MAEKNKVDELEETITRFYERYSAQRVALATFLVGFFSLLASLAVYGWLQSGLFAALAGLFVGFIGINSAFLLIVPPDKSLANAKNLICGALREPSRIKSYDMQKVQLADANGKVQTLAARELSLWKSLVVPYLIECQASGQEPLRGKSQRTLTASERKYIEERRKELLEIEKKIEEERKSLESQRAEMKRLKANVTQPPFPGSERLEDPDQNLKSREAALDARYNELESEAQALEKRASFVTDSENSLIERLDALTQREASIEQSEVNAGLRKD